MIFETRIWRAAHWLNKFTFLKLAALVPIYFFFHVFETNGFNYELVLVGRILYINTHSRHHRLSLKIFSTLIVAFSGDIMFRCLIYQYEPQDVPKLMFSILFAVICTVVQHLLRFKFDYPIFYSLSQAKIQSWAVKLMLNERRVPKPKLSLPFVMASLFAAGLYQNLLLGSKKAVWVNTIAILTVWIVLQAMPYLRFDRNSLSAHREKFYLTQFIFHLYKYLL